MQINTEDREELLGMKKVPKTLDYQGEIKLLDALKISIVGTRRPSKYSRAITQQLASALAKAGVVVVSGGAMGIDATAHKGAKSAATIAVLPCGIDKKYPAVNRSLLEDIGRDGLLLSQFEEGFSATAWSFVLRNELVVALGEVLIVSEADLDSGSMRSVAFAQKMGKEIYVLPQRIGESEATNQLLQENKAKAIYNIDSFVSEFIQAYAPETHACKIRVQDQQEQDPFYTFCKTTPSYDALLQAFPSRVFEAELNGEISIKNGKVYLEN